MNLKDHRSAKIKTKQHSVVGSRVQDECRSLNLKVAHNHWKLAECTVVWSLKTSNRLSTVANPGFVGQWGGHL